MRGISIRILQIIPYFTPRRGGDVNVVYNLSKHLAERGNEVTIITTNFEFDDEYSKSLKSVKVIPFNCIANLSLFLYSPDMKKWLGENIKYFDVIHLHCFRSYQNNAVYKYAKKDEIPYVLQAHGSVLPFFAKQRLKKLYDLVWGHRILKNASKVIALTKTEADQYKKMGVNKDKIEIVPNGINLSEYEKLPDKGTFRRKYLIKNDEKIILYLGRLHKSKGIDLLIKAIAFLVNKLDQFRLIIVGPDDGYKFELEELIQSLKVKEKVLFTGFVSNDEKMAAFVDADVFVTPSFSGFPVTFLEALACNTPIITTTSGDELEWIHNNVGYVVEYNEDKLYFAITTILDNDDLYLKFQDNCNKLIEKYFLLENITLNVGIIYESISKHNNNKL